MLLENKNAVIGCRQFHRRDSARFVRFVTRECVNGRKPARHPAQYDFKSSADKKSAS
jgi:hypothetical protein